MDSFYGFTGSNTLSLDPQKRFAVPTEYRKGIEEATNNQLIVVQSFQGQYLDMYPTSVWDAIYAKICRLGGPANTLSSNVNRVKRKLIGTAAKVTIDKSFRMLIPIELREFAEITSELTLVGSVDRFEIWKPELWQEENKKGVSDETLSKLGLLQEVPDETLAEQGLSP